MKVEREGESKSKRLVKLILKIAVTVLCFWYISGKINWQQAWETILSVKPLWIILAFLFFILSKLISAVRLKLYFENAGVDLSSIQNIRLYWLGMFYNLFLPGSITGDAYKVVTLKKKYDVSYKKITSAVLLDRFSGLLGLTTILAVMGVFVLGKKEYMLLTAGAVFLILVFYLIVRKWFPDFIKSFTTAFFLGLLVQGVQVICIYMILNAVGIKDHIPQYMFIFLLSSILSVLPLTVGGLGIREVVFLEGSKYFALPQEISVSISLIFYLVSMLTALFGAYFIFRDPLKNKDPLLSP